MRIIGEIPARLGSERVKQKNTRLLCGKPLIAYAIEAAKYAKTLTESYVNSESDVIGKIALDYGIKFYKRDPQLANNTATSDQFNYDFIKGTKADVLVLINPVAPLVESKDIDEVVNYFLVNNFDTVITTREEHLQAFCQNKPINFNPDGQLPRTQDIAPIQLCAWSVCVWRAATFLESYDKKGYAVFSGNVGFYPLSPFKTVKISTEDDFALAQAILQYVKAK